MFFRIHSVKDNYLLSPTTMVTMDLPTAVKSYQYGERAKSELIMISQFCLALTGFSEQERAGGRRMLLMMMESARSELQFAAQSTGQAEFQKAINALNEAISLIGKQPARTGIPEGCSSDQCIHHTGTGSMAGTLGTWTPLISLGS